MRHLHIPALLIVGLGAVAISACGSDAESESPPAVSSEATSSLATVSFDDAWARRPVAGQTAGAVYGELINSGTEAVTAIAVRTGVTDQAELHEVVSGDDGSMTMRERPDGFEVPAGGDIMLEPGSFHIMLLDIDPATYPDEIDVEIEFDDGSVLTATAPVRAVDEPMDMDDDTDGEMDTDSDS